MRCKDVTFQEGQEEAGLHDLFNVRSSAEKSPESSYGQQARWGEVDQLVVQWLGW